MHRCVHLCLHQYIVSFSTGLGLWFVWSLLAFWTEHRGTGSSNIQRSLTWSWFCHSTSCLWISAGAGAAVFFWMRLRTGSNAQKSLCSNKNLPLNGALMAVWADGTGGNSIEGKQKSMQWHRMVENLSCGRSRIFICFNVTQGILTNSFLSVFVWRFSHIFLLISTAVYLPPFIDALKFYSCLSYGQQLWGILD